MGNTPHPEKLFIRLATLASEIKSTVNASNIPNLLLVDKLPSCRNIAIKKGHMPLFYTIAQTGIMLLLKIQARKLSLFWFDAGIKDPLNFHFLWILST